MSEFIVVVPLTKTLLRQKTHERHLLQKRQNTEKVEGWRLGLQNPIVVPQPYPIICGQFSLSAFSIYFYAAQSRRLFRSLLNLFRVFFYRIQSNLNNSERSVGVCSYSSSAVSALLPCRCSPMGMRFVTDLIALYTPKYFYYRLFCASGHTSSVFELTMRPRGHYSMIF